jgi:hypothetical protein
MTSKARQIVAFAFMIALGVQNMLLGALIAQNYNAMRRASGLQEPTVTEVARVDYVSSKKQELVVLLAVVAISMTMNALASMIFVTAKKIDF